MLDYMLTADAMLREANMGVLDKLKIVALAKRLGQTGRSAVSGCGFPRQLLRLRPVAGFYSAVDTPSQASNV